MSKTAAVLAARDLLPGMFGANDASGAEVDADGHSDAGSGGAESDAEDDEHTQDQQQRHEDVVDDLQYDLFNLLACNYHSLRVVEGQTVEDVITEGAERATRLLMKR